MANEKLIRLMTYNIGGGWKEIPLLQRGGGKSKDNPTTQRQIIATIKKINPDILGVQECTEWVDANQVKSSFCEQIAKATNFGRSYFFGETISMKENMQVKKTMMIYGLFHDWQNWAQGNAVYSKFGFSRLGESDKAGTPRNVPLYRPAIYEGTRDTDPRYAIVSRIKFPPIYPYLVCLHLTTLIGERGGESKEIPGKSAEAQMLRFLQMKTLFDLLRSKIKEKEVIIILGDFNADDREACISSVFTSIEPGFVRLVPKNDRIRTHPEAEKSVDHILVYPSDRIARYDCWVDESETAQAASDHLPVVADIVFK